MDWEAWLKAAAAPPSNSEDEKRVRTEGEIKLALAASERLKGRPYVVYSKGSYANNTNVRLNYDVDIAVEYRGYFYTEYVLDLEGYTDADVGLVSSGDPYTRSQFKADIRAALVKAYGASAITDGRIAYRVREQKTTLPADVVPSWQYRRYDTLVGSTPYYHEGARVFPSDGGHKDNFPKIQLENGIAKNKRTSLRYKRMVRALKKLQTRLVEHGELREELPSYLTECLVYNVPDDGLGHVTFKADMRSVLAHIFNGTLEGGGSRDWEEVNGLRYLMRGANSWTPADVHRMADVAWDHVGFD
jgi:hypothetical protein